MTIEPELIGIYLLVLSLSTLAWAALATSPVSAELRFTAAKSAAPSRRTPVRLVQSDVAPLRSLAASPTRQASGEAATAPAAVSQPAACTQMTRLNSMVMSAVSTAHSAERFHRAASEQVDSAHYALQNLLNELSAVMPVATPAAAARATKLPVRPLMRQDYDVALAA